MVRRDARCDSTNLDRRSGVDTVRELLDVNIRADENRKTLVGAVICHALTVVSRNPVDSYMG